MSDKLTLADRIKDCYSPVSFSPEPVVPKTRKKPTTVRTTIQDIDVSLQRGFFKQAYQHMVHVLETLYGLMRADSVLEASKQSSLDLMRRALAAHPDASWPILSQLGDLPEEALDMKIASASDHYDSLGMNPHAVQYLVDKLTDTFTPGLVISTANGSTGSGLMLSHLLDKDIYFVPQMRVHNAWKPMLSSTSKGYLQRKMVAGPLLLFYSSFFIGAHDKLHPLQRDISLLNPQKSGEHRTGAALAHQPSPKRPDYYGSLLSDL